MTFVCNKGGKTGLTGKASYKVDLGELHAVCEANYARMVRLFPDYDTCNEKRFRIGRARVRIEVVDRARYTTIFRVHQQQAEDPWLGHLFVELRAYHDAAMLEVGMFQSHRRMLARYRYPNRRMYQQDEKFQQNRFMAEWLSHCLHNGQSILDPRILTRAGG